MMMNLKTKIQLGVCAWLCFAAPAGSAAEPAYDVAPELPVPTYRQQSASVERWKAQDLLRDHADLELLFELNLRAQKLWEKILQDVGGDSELARRAFTEGRLDEDQLGELRELRANFSNILETAEFSLPALRNQKRYVSAPEISPLLFELLAEALARDLTYPAAVFRSGRGDAPLSLEAGGQLLNLLRQRLPDISAYQQQWLAFTMLHHEAARSIEQEAVRTPIGVTKKANLLMLAQQLSWGWCESGRSRGIWPKASLAMVLQAQRFSAEADYFLRGGDPSQEAFFSANGLKCSDGSIFPEFLRAQDWKVVEGYRARLRF